MAETPAKSWVLVPASPPELERPGDAVAPELRAAAQEVLPAPLPGERYHLRGLTEMWARELADDALRDDREPHTARSYTQAVAGWLRYCLLQNVDPTKARRTDVDHWIAGHDWGPSTVRLRLAGVASWYGYLIANDVETTDPAARVKRPKRKRHANGSDTPHLDTAEFVALLAEATRQAEMASGPEREIAQRNSAILHVLLTTGVRSGPIQRPVLPRDLEQRRDRLILHYRVKGGEHTTKTLVPDAANPLLAYLDLRAARVGVGRDQLTGPLFASVPYRGKPGGKPLSSGYLAALIRRIAKDAGLARAERLVPHSTRHTVATALGANRSLAEVQTYLDHQDPRTTRLYLRVNDSTDLSLAYTMASLIHGDEPET